MTTDDAADDDMVMLIAELVALRHRRGVTQVELSARTGLTQQAISRFEHKSTGHLLTAVSYARGLGARLVVQRPSGDFELVPYAGGPSDSGRWPAERVRLPARP